MYKESITTILTLTALLLTTTATALSFDTGRLRDSQQSNYIKFIGQNPSISNAYDKITVDLNNDGFEDIISIGGHLRCAGCSVQPPTPIQPIEIMLYKDGDFTSLVSDFSTDGVFAAIVDIDIDGDQDMILRNGKIAYNDGQANFTEAAFTTDVLPAQQIFTADWDNDNDIDIITAQTVYQNNGTSGFSAQIQYHWPKDIKNFMVVDLNSDNTKDLLINSNGQLQSWINSGNGLTTLFSSLPIDASASLNFKSFDFNNDGTQDFFMVKDHTSITTLINDGQGQFTIESFALPEAIDGMPHDHIAITSIHTIDANNDNDRDVWINATLQNLSSHCSFEQNLLMIYDNNGQGQLQLQKILHSTGYDTHNRSHLRSNMPTIIDINNDHLPDVISTGEQPLTWQHVSGQPYDFALTAASTIHFNQRIQMVDYNQDNMADILSTGYNASHCSTIGEIDKVQSATHKIHATGTLWLGQSNGQFIAYDDPYNRHLFTAAYQYSTLVNLDQNGNQHLIATYPHEGKGFSMSYYIDPNAPDFMNHMPLPYEAAQAFDEDMGFGQGKEIILQDPYGDIFIIEKSPATSGLVSEEFTTVYAIIAQPGFVNTEFALQDMDNNGYVDVIVLSKSDTTSFINIWYNNGKILNASAPFANNTKTMTIGDFNGDKLSDIFVINPEKDIWLNLGQGSFTKTTYDQAIWLEPFPVDSQNLVSVTPEKIIAHDINNDGLSDLFAYMNDSLNVYINNTQDNLSFYKNYNHFAPRSQTSEPLSHHNIQFADFNHDGLLDFASGSHNTININTQSTLELTAGLYYDPTHNGHGYSIEEIGKDNLYHAIFFTYDNHGKPQWFSMLNQLEAQENYWKLDRINGNNIMHYTYDRQTNIAAVDHLPENSGWMTFFNNKQQPSIDHVFFQIGDHQDMWSLQPIISNTLPSGDNFSGLWWAGQENAGWGLSISSMQHQQSQQLLAILYFYDENGQPRWLMGQSDEFHKDQDITINMKQITGYHYRNDPTELTETAAGTITVNLHTPSKDITKAGKLSMDIHYPDDTLNNNWIKNNIPIALFSQRRKP